MICIQAGLITEIGNVFLGCRGTQSAFKTLGQGRAGTGAWHDPEDPGNCGIFANFRVFRTADRLKPLPTAIVSRHLRDHLPDITIIIRNYIYIMYVYVYIYIHIWFIKSYRLPSFPVISQTATRSGQMCCLSARCQFETLLGWDRRQPLLPWGEPSDEPRFHPEMDGVISIMTTFVGAPIFNHTHLNRSLSLVQSSKTPQIIFQSCAVNSCL